MLVNLPQAVKRILGEKVLADSRPKSSSLGAKECGFESLIENRYL
jgi:hypothetical protein